MNDLKIYISNTDDRLTVASILIKNGYIVTIRKEKQGAGNRNTVSYVKAWKEDDGKSKN